MKRLTIVLLLMVVIASVPASAEDNAKAGVSSSKKMLAKNSAGSELPATESRPMPVEDPDYKIGVADVLDVHVWKEAELSRVVTVRPDGKITLPLAGEIEAAGKSAVQIREVVAERLKAFISDPEVTVIVQATNSKRFFVVGEVNNPGTYPLTVPITIVEALAMAGGFREWADTEHIMVLRRNENNTTTRITISYKDWLKLRKPVYYGELQNGDVVVVP